MGDRRQQQPQQHSAEVGLYDSISSILQRVIHYPLASAATAGGAAATNKSSSQEQVCCTQAKHCNVASYYAVSASCSASQRV